MRLGVGIVIPAGTEHNVINGSTNSSFYLLAK
jgi:quercetin dioxygenase-like cupin family protein